MVIGLRGLLSTGRALTYDNLRRLWSLHTMPKRPRHRPPVKKLKSTHSAAAPPRHELQSSRPNLRPASNMTAQDEQPTLEKSSVKVEYLDTPTRSENDKKEYRVIKLENGLTALLIADIRAAGEVEEEEEEDKVDPINSETEESADDEEDDEEDEEDEDEEEDSEHEDNGEDTGKSKKKLKREEKMAACGLSVGVGSFSDPPEIPGLAHFLEHMVFMGSEKYPQENNFDMFIKKRGGSDNASTECEVTTFYFEIQEKHLLAGLDRFAQFFIKPLMKRDAISRERESVESEFQMALPSDYYRREQLFCSFARANHPATKFTWGNLVTLRDNVQDEKLYEELHKFRERHYSAHRMKLAIQARLPLDTLEDYVKQCFARVPSNNLPADDFTEFKGANSFDTPSFRRMYKIKPVKDLCHVELSWCLPPMLDMYRSKPYQYVSWVLGHEGEGSLISYLRKKMWCLVVTSGNGETGSELNSMFTLFKISMHMTDEGHRRLEEVLNAVFGYINLMRKEGPQKRIYDEIQQIEETNFRFTDEVPPAEYVEDLSENMHVYPPKDYITGSELYFEYNPEAIQACMDCLTPDNLNITVSDKLFKDDEFDKVEPWFQTKYSDEEIPGDWIDSWRTMEPLPEFHLPSPNVYLTDDFSLITLPEDVPKYPSKIFADDICELWYRPDTKFRLPECYMNFYLISPAAVDSPKSAALMDLYINILKQLLTEELYAATVAELQHDISTSDKGMILRLSGFNQKLPILLSTIVKYIADSPRLISKELFEVMKKQQIKEYYNTFLKPQKLVKDVRLSLLMEPFYSRVATHAAIRSAEFDEFQDFVKSFTQHVYIQSLVQGNISESSVVKNVRSALEILKCGAVKREDMPRIKVSEIPLGVTYCKVRNFDRTDANSVVTNYYQCDLSSTRLSVTIELVIMIMEEPLFNQLRTLEQLGYNVFCMVRDTFGVLGYSITVCSQADKYSTEHLDVRIESFLEEFKKTLQKTSEKELESVKEALIKLKQRADIHLKEEVDRNWMEITTAEYSFDRIEKDLLMIEQIDIHELRRWMEKHTIGGENLRKLSIQVAGTPKEKETDVDMDDSEKEIENGLPTAADDCPLMFIDNKVETEAKDSKYITDIRGYKSSLKVYPSRAAL